MFLELNEDDLKGLEIKLGDRGRIMRIVNEKKRNEYVTATAITSETSEAINITDISISSEDSMLLKNTCISEVFLLKLFFLIIIINLCLFILMLE